MATTEALTRYLEEAKIEELAADWEARGYKVTRRARLGDVEADLVAERGDERIIVEVVTGGTLARNRERTQALSQWVAQHPNTSFRMVAANPPRSRRIRVKDLSDIILDHLISSDTLPELDVLASHVAVDAVDGVEVLLVEIESGEIRIAGEAFVGVRLQYGSDADVSSDDGLVSEESFPMDFDVVVDCELHLLRVNSLRVDTSSFYE